MNSDPGLQIQLQSHREKPVFPSSLTLVKNLATDIPRFESVQILLRAVHKIIPFLCPPQWDGSAATVETCLKCLFHLVSFLKPSVNALLSERVEVFSLIKVETNLSL